MKEIIGMDQCNDFILDCFNNNKTILLFFSAKWCGPCKDLKNRLESQEGKIEMPNLEVGYIDIEEDDNSNLNDIYKIKSLPTQIFITLDGNNIKVLKKIAGYDWINLLMSYEEFEN
jgi:thiol-disulfide isomerase/thioredoxin